MSVYTQDVISVGEVCPNIYLEPSWCSGQLIGQMINKLGPDRVMMGSDWISNYPVEKLKIDLLELNEDDKNKVLCETAKTVFKLGDRI